MQMYGNDLNPVAWFVVKNELAQVDPREVQRLLDRIEAEVKPQIMPFYACDCPRGHKGKWTHKATGKVMGPDFDPLALTPEERPQYEYSGPEVIYTFWAKHGPCQATGCQHRTPIMSSPVIAVKTLTVKAWKDVECKKCGGTFDVEEQDARMAPAALFVVSPDESPYAVQDQHGHVTCPHCHNKLTNILSAKPKNKGVELTLLIHPDWLKGSPCKDEEGKPFGGSATDSAAATALWNAERAKTSQADRGQRASSRARSFAPIRGRCFTRTGEAGQCRRNRRFTCKEDTCGQSVGCIWSLSRCPGRQVRSPYTQYKGIARRATGKGDRTQVGFSQSPIVGISRCSQFEWDARRGLELSGFLAEERIVPYGYMTTMINGTNLRIMGTLIGGSCSIRDNCLYYTQAAQDASFSSDSRQDCCRLCVLAHFSNICETRTCFHLGY